jgi:Tol biopolymer transport system component
MPEDPHPQPRQMPDVVGGRYRIVSRLGVGGMGVVYKAHDLQLNRSVALKALEDRRASLPGATARLRTEALAAASLDHPYICKVYELVETGHETLIVMEYVEGETLASMLKRGILPLPQVLQLGREIAEGLANAHARGLVHRDVKPSNVMVTTHGHVKLLDFGVAGADVESTPADATRTLMPQLTVHAGTPQYMAPEQAAGQPISTRADLFSLGVVLYECLTRQLPFSGSTTFDYVRHVMQSPPRRLDRVAPDTPADLVDLIDRLLEKTPADRPESADAVVAALRGLEETITGATGEIRTARQARASRRWKVVAAGALAVAAAAFGWQFFAPRPDAPARQSRPFVTTAAFESGSRISPDGQWVSFISRAGGQSRILVQRIDGGEARPLTLGPGNPVSQIWSPDGNQIAAAMQLDNRLSIQVYPAFFGGAPLQSIAIAGTLNQVQLVRWIDRSVYLAVTLRGSSGIDVQRVSPDASGEMTSVSSQWPVDGVLRSADISPDGRMAVIGVSKDGKEDLWTLNTDGSSPRQLTADAFFDRDPLWIGRGESVVFRSNRGGQVDLWEIDIRSRTLTPLTTSESEEIAESSSASGDTVSFRQLTKNANLWAFGGQAPQQLTQDSLSDYSPALSGNGRVLAFQRSQPTPSSGYTILDAKVFVSDLEGGLVGDAKAVGDGYAADLSEDGQWLAFMQPSDRTARMSLSVRDLRGGTTSLVTKTATLPSLTLSPVEWATRLTAWDHSSALLYFVDQPETCEIRVFDAAIATAGKPVATARNDAYLRDLYVSRETGRLAYVSAAKPAVTVHELDPKTKTIRDLASFDQAARKAGLVGRGWFDGQFLLIRSALVHEDLSADVDVLLTTSAGGIREIGRITNVFASTIRLHSARRTLYMTRTDKGAGNIYAYSLDTGSLTAMTQNVLPGVTFSGFQPLSPQGILGVREERREDIWLIQQTAAPRSGNPAGR